MDFIRTCIDNQLTIYGPFVDHKSYDHVYYIKDENVYICNDYNGFKYFNINQMEHIHKVQNSWVDEIGPKHEYLINMDILKAFCLRYTKE